MSSTAPTRQPPQRQDGTVASIASSVVETLSTGKQVPPFTQQHADFDISTAYKITAEVRDLRQRRGETPIGRKIGFTNRTIWDEYNVHAPIWSFVYDKTVHALLPSDEEAFALCLDGIPEPRIEPEIVFGLVEAPTADMDDVELMACIGWVTHGFEIVQSVFRGWKFLPADTVAAFGLHAALVIGARHAVTASRTQAWIESLAGLQVDLFCDGVRKDHGRGANVLGSPLAALRHLVELLAEDRFNEPLAKGEIVTTGTLTKALPVKKGEIWHTRLSGIALDDARIKFS